MRSLQAPGGEIVSLTDGEFHMLDAFVTRPDVIHTRENMIALSGRIDALAKDRTIDVNISRLRRKLAAFDGTEIIRTVRGKGYVFIADVTGA
jgi:two-component system OmpR family response regulator